MPNYRLTDYDGRKEWVNIDLDYPRVDVFPVVSSARGWQSRELNERFLVDGKLKCATQLAIGDSYIGTYYAGKNIRSTYFVVSHTEYSCPHCALQSADAIDLGAGKSIAICLTGPGVKLDQSYTRLIDERGLILSHHNTETFVPPGRACGTCGLLGHDSRNCGYEGKSIDKIGIEIEGRWRDLYAAENKARARGMEWCEDCSIAQPVLGNSSTRRMEFKTKPGSLKDALTQLHELYPDETDGSCGMHVHVSFRDYTYISQLATDEFYEYFRERWTQWAQCEGLPENGSFMRRLSGHNDFCNPNKPGTDDVYDCDRYKQLNFMAWGEHKTVECRLLPMFRSEALAQRAVQELITIYEDWLQKDFCAKFPKVAVEAPQFDNFKHKADLELAVPADFVHAAEQEIPVIDLPPAPEGHRRVYIPADILEMLSTRGVAI